MLADSSDPLAFIRMSQNLLHLQSSNNFISESSYKSAQTGQSAFSDLYEINLVRKSRNSYI